MLMKIRDTLMNLRIYILRSLSYLSLINTGMILFLFLSKLKEIGFIKIEIDKLFIPLFIVSFILAMLLGWFEVKILKTFKLESKVIFEHNPPMVDMKNKIDKIYEEMEKKNGK